MGRKNRASTRKDYSDHELYQEFAQLEEMRKLKTEGKSTGSLTLKHIKPITTAQQVVFDDYNAGKNLLLHGLAGTGKSFISLYLALRDVIIEKKYDRVLIIRSVVQTRDMGHLPGDVNQKIDIFQTPYIEICRKLFGLPKAYEKLKEAGTIEFMSSSFVRGLSLDNSIVIVDEASNCNFHELDSLITRLEETSKIIFCGDYTQSDLKGKEKDGFQSFIKILKEMSQFSFVEFHEEDIVRSKLVKDYIITKLRLESSL